MANPCAALPWAWCALLTIVGACSVDNFADRVEPRTALDRPGTYHAGFNVRVTDEQGRPVKATVSVVGPWDGVGRERVATTTTNEAGYAELRNVSSTRSLYVREVYKTQSLYLSVEPSEQLRPLSIRLEGVTSGIADLGVLRLKPNMVITGTVKRVVDGGTPTPEEDGHVSLLAVDDGERLAWATVRDGWFRLDDFDIEPMEVEFDDSRVALPINPELERQHFDLLVDRNVLSIKGRDVAPKLPVAEEVPTHRIDMRLVDTEGEPIADARVSVVGNTQVPDAITDAGGRFSMVASDVPEKLYVTGPWGIVSIGGESPEGPVGEHGRAPHVLSEIIGQSEVVIPVQRRLEIEVAGIDPGDLAYGSKDFGHQWRVVEETLVKRLFDDRGYRTLLRVDAPGRLPRFAAYPPDGPLVLDFTMDTQHKLVVIDDAGPIAGATVDMTEAATPYLDTVAVNDPAADIVLATLGTDASGRLARLGDPNALYVAYVYADGYQPARVLVEAGTETRVELAKRDTRVEFTGLTVGELLRVKVAGLDSLVAFHRVEGASRVVASLAPGTYDVTVESADQTIERGNTVVVDGEPRVVDTTVDRRPALVLRLPVLPIVPEGYRSEEEKAAATPPLDRWTVWASRRTPPALVFSDLGELASRTTGANALFEVDAPPGPVAGGVTRTVRFSGGGRWLVYAAAERSSLGHFFFVEVELAAGEERELRLPPLDASLEGSMTYEGDLEWRHHGVAGPRMLLIRAAGADAGWNVGSDLPKRLAREGAQRHHFVLEDLPAGDYHLFHHLGEHSAWGGIDVPLRADTTTRIPRLGTEPTGTWTVEVVDSVGRPVRDQMLVVRDRMYEAWEANSELAWWLGYTTTSMLAADSFPLPPAARLKGEPVTFDSIRPGWVELVLDDPAGPARHYLRKAEPGTGLTLVVDD